MIPTTMLSQDTPEILSDYIHAADALLHRYGIPKSAESLDIVLKWLVFFQQNVNAYGPPVNEANTPPIEGGTLRVRD
jgi:hypothetical protein